jgi:hypothetical protein
LHLKKDLPLDVLKKLLDFWLRNKPSKLRLKNKTNSKSKKLRSRLTKWKSKEKRQRLKQQKRVVMTLEQLT